MNLKDLHARLQAIDEGVAIEKGVEECGMDMMPMSAPKQPDNVNMSINMSGNGAGGIQDLLSILKHIDKLDAPGKHHDDNVVFGMPGEHDHNEPVMGDILDDMEEEYANSAAGRSGPEYMGVDSVTPTGDDLASKGIEKLKVNGGGNPMQEELISRLAELYQSIKEGEGKPKTMSRAAKGHEKYGKKGMQALAKAGQDGASEEKMDKIRDKYNRYDENIQENSVFGSYAAEALALAVYKKNPHLSTDGRAEELQDAGWAILSHKLGKKYARYKFNYDEDFPSDFVSSYHHLQQHGVPDEHRDFFEGLNEAAKWRDSKYKDKLYTQEPDDEDDDYGSDSFYGHSRPENDPGKKHRMGGVRHEYDRSGDQLHSYYGSDSGNTTGGSWRGKTSHSPYKDSGVSVKGPRKGLLTKNATRNVKDRIKGALGKHPEPSLPETSINESNDIIKLSKMLNG